MDMNQERPDPHRPFAFPRDGPSIARREDEFASPEAAAASHGTVQVVLTIDTEADNA